MRKEEKLEKYWKGLEGRVWDIEEVERNGEVEERRENRRRGKQER